MLVWTQGNITCELELKEDRLSIPENCELEWDNADYIYDDFGEIVGVNGPGGEVFSLVYGDQKEMDEVKDSGEPSKFVSESGIEVKFENVGKDNILWTQGNITCELEKNEDRISVPDDCELEWEDSSFIFDEFGEVVAVNGPNGEVFSIFYEDNESVEEQEDAIE